MKCLTDRTEIAKAMNFGKYPVLYLNMDNRVNGIEYDFCTGSKVRIAWDDPRPRYEGMTERGTVYHSEGKIGFLSDICRLKDSFGRQDVLEMVEWAQAPLIHKGDTVVLVQDWPSLNACRVRMMKMPDRISKFTTTIAVLEDMEEDA